MKRVTILAVFLSLILGFTTRVAAQDSTQTELNKKKLSGNPGNTHLLLTGVAWFGGQANMKTVNPTDIKTNFNDFGFSPMFLYKLSDKFFFESEIEIKNDGSADNGAAFDLEFAKLSCYVNKYMTIGAGKMLSPFGAYNEKWEPNHIERFPNSPLRPDDGVLPDDSHLFWGAVMGMDVRGKFDLGCSKLTYALYVSNGPKLSTDTNGRPTGVIQYENWNDNNNNKEIGGRIGFLPFSNNCLEIGFSAKSGIASGLSDTLYNQTRDTMTVNMKASATAIDLNFVKSISEIKSIIGIRGQFTTFKMDNAHYYLSDSATYTFDNTMTSYFAQLSIRPALVDDPFFKNLEFLVRYNAVTPPKGAIWGPKDANGNGGSITRLDLGLDYWLSWRTGLRLAYEMTTMPDGTKSTMIVARLATGL